MSATRQLRSNNNSSVSAVPIGSPLGRTSDLDSDLDDSRFATLDGSESSSLPLPPTSAKIKDLRLKLSVHDGTLTRLAKSSKLTSDDKQALSQAAVDYQTAFNLVCSAYAKLVSSNNVAEECRRAVSKACEGITRSCVDSVRTALNRHVPTLLKECLPDLTAMVKENLPEASLDQPTGVKSFSNAVKAPGPKIHVPKGPTVVVQDTQTFVLAPTTEATDKYPNYEKAREAAIGLLSKSQMKLRIENIRCAGKNNVRIEARSVDIEKVKALPALATAGLEVKEDPKACSSWHSGEFQQRGHHIGPC